MFLTVQIKDPLVNSLHAEAGKQWHISEKGQNSDRNFLLHQLRNCGRKWVKGCQICVQDQRVNNILQKTPELISILEEDLSPEDVMQIDLIAKSQ